MHNLQLAGILGGEALGAGAGAAASSGSTQGTAGGAAAGAAAGIIAPPVIARLLMSRRPFGGAQGYLATSRPPPGLFSTAPGNVLATQKVLGLFNPPQQNSQGGQ
jgi:hypothetical protein